VNRITPERVKDAYDKTGLIPIQDVWIRRWDSGDCEACALSAVMVAEGKASEDELIALTNAEDDAEPDAAKALDLAKDYEFGFVEGFDASPDGKPARKHLLNSQGYLLGFADGQKAALVYWPPEE
jgi:hypothetical protein